MPRTVLTQSLANEIVNLLADGVSVRETAKTMGLSTSSTIHEWAKKNAEIAPDRTHLEKPLEDWTQIDQEIDRAIKLKETGEGIGKADNLGEVCLVRFHGHYSRARELGFLVQADMLLEIADDASGDLVLDANGNPRVDHENINRARLRIDTRKFILAKMLPKVYGEKINPDAGSPVKIVLAGADADL